MENKKNLKDVHKFRTDSYSCERLHIYVVD